MHVRPKSKSCVSLLRMPIYTEEGEALVKHGKCHGVRIDLKDCLKVS